MGETTNISIETGFIGTVFATAVSGCCCTQLDCFQAGSCVRGVVHILALLRSWTLLVSIGANLILDSLNLLVQLLTNQYFATPCSPRQAFSSSWMYCRAISVVVWVNSHKQYSTCLEAVLIHPCIFLLNLC